MGNCEIDVLEPSYGGLVKVTEGVELGPPDGSGMG